MNFNTDTHGIACESLVVEIATLTEETDGFRHKIVIAVDAKSADVFDAFVSSLEVLIQAFSVQMHPLPADTIASIVSLMVPKKPVTPILLREARMLAQAKTEILQSYDWLTASEISAFAQGSGVPSPQPNNWKDAGRIFALRHEGVDYFPIYGLDPRQGFQPIPALEDVIATLSTMKDGWAMAFWFASSNSYLGGKCPKEMLSVNPSGVLTAAKEEVAGVTHG
ncbi:hypothetical protein HNO86_03670 [Pseudomonas sp. C1C7]|uniref:hypothetical protein n=1 Tax=Pseudomonas sp. C1C7 TaxID=2735272 RepID=UPI001586655D|nr:hypothetical protein [Pseudomonas sp. C1C7]NUT74138.1 hypothetical protein [Pseudomonas sp. C1C7]